MNDHLEPPTLDPASENVKHERPKKLLQRLSSGLSTILPGIASRRVSSSTHASDRPETAPSHTHEHRRRKTRSRSHVLNDEAPIVPQLDIPQLSDADVPCPYDPSTYHSFPSVEDERCSFRGLRPFSRAVSVTPASHRPCSHCRSRTPSSHLASSFRRSSRRTSTSRATSSDLPTLSETSPSSEDIPRIVPYEIAAQRIGNPPRTSSLPPGLTPSYRTSHLSPAHARDPGTHLHDHLHYPNSSTSSQAARPVSPRLHHQHLLPHPHEHPYIRKSEVSQHIAALEAGSPSPLPQVLDEGPAIPISNEPYRDFSRTVYYGTTPSSAASTASSLIIRRVEVVDERVLGTGGRSRLRLRVDEVEIREQGVGRQSGSRSTRSGGRVPRASNGQRTSGTSSTQTHLTPIANEVQTIGIGVGEMHLRGGGQETPVSRPYSSRSHPFLVCHGDIPRLSSRTAHQRSPHPTYSTLHQSPYPSHHHDDSPTPYQPASGLRGGASSPTPSSSPSIPSSLSSNPLRIPPSLYFLAGGTGRKPITLNAWKKQRGTRRFGGLLGMAVFGERAGSPYSKDSKEESICASSSEHGDEDGVGIGGRSGNVSRSGRTSSVAGSSRSERTGMYIASFALGSSSGSSSSSGTARSRTGSAREGSTRGQSTWSIHSTSLGSVAVSERSAAPLHHDNEREGPIGNVVQPVDEDRAGSVDEAQTGSGGPGVHRDKGVNASARA